MVTVVAPTGELKQPVSSVTVVCSVVLLSNITRQLRTATWVRLSLTMYVAALFCAKRHACTQKTTMKRAMFLICYSGKELLQFNKVSS